MDFDKLKQDSRTSLHKAVINEPAYDKSVSRLRNFSFWSAPKNGLWEHQQIAICTAIAYIHGERRLPGRQGVTVIRSNFAKKTK